MRDTQLVKEATRTMAAVDFLGYRYEDRVVRENAKRTPTRAGFGMRHIEALYLFAILAALHMTRAGAQITTLAITRQNDGDAQRDWNYRTQATIYISFYAGYCLSSAPAEAYDETLDPKYAIFVVLLANGLLSFATPVLIEKGGWFALCNVRLLLGACHAWTPSAVRTLLRRWIPPQERSVLAAFAHSGILIGTVISFPSAGRMSQSAIGWRMIFYMWGAVSLSAATVWCVLTSAEPAGHRAIGDAEKEYIRRSIEEHAAAGNARGGARWRRLLSVRAFWATTASHVATQLMHTQLSFLMPIFLSGRSQMSTHASGWCVGAAFLAMGSSASALLCVCGALYRDTILAHLVDITTYRKLLNSAGSLGVALGLSSLSMVSVERDLLIVLLLVFTYTCVGLKTCGFMENAADAIPECSGTALRLSTMIANVVCCSVPALDSLVLEMSVSEECRWRVIYWCSACVCVACDVVYVMFSSSEPDAWKSDRLESVENDEMAYDMKELTDADDG